MPISGNHKIGVQDVKLLDASGRVVETRKLTIRSGRFAKQNVQLTRALTQLRSTPDDIEALAAFRTVVTENRFWAEPFVPPVDGCMVSPYGFQRYHNGRPTGSYHSGIDSRGAAGTPVRAVAAGTVRLVRPFQVSGNTVGIDHGQGLLSMYLHLSAFAVRDGMTVEKGDIVGYVGSTGRSTAPHLHWSIMANGVGVNPAQWIALKPCPGAPGSTPARPKKSR
jgi:lysostaphin